jgi:hypothetical protein
MFGWLTNTIKPEPATLDHLPVNVANEPAAEAKAVAPGEGLSHEQKLKLAAQRAGKPFRCATDGLPREVIKNGAPVTVGVKPAPAPEPPPKVTTIGRKAAR